MAFMAAGNPLVAPRRLAKVHEQLANAIRASGGEIVRLAVRRAMEPAPEIVIATGNPARYLRHRLLGVLRLMRADHNVYLAVVDQSGRIALEWAVNGDKTPNSGSLYVRPALEACSPISASGNIAQPPRCPAR